MATLLALTRYITLPVDWLAKLGLVRMPGRYGWVPQYRLTTSQQLRLMAFDMRPVSLESQRQLFLSDPPLPCHSWRAADADVMYTLRHNRRKRGYEHLLRRDGQCIKTNYIWKNI